MREKVWEISCPSGQIVKVPAKTEDEALLCLKERWDLVAAWKIPDLLRAAGYRAKPVEEPKMVTVPARLLTAALWLGEIGYNSLVNTVSIQGIPRTDHARKTVAELRAALDGAK